MFRVAVVVGVAVGLFAPGRAWAQSTVRLRLRSSTPSVAVYRLAPQGWAAVCATPCGVDVAPGSVVLGASLDERVVVAAPAVDLRGDAQLLARYESRAAWRYAGVAALSAGLVGGLLVSQITTCGHASGVFADAIICGGHPYVGLGVGIGVVGALVSIPLLLQRDRVSFVPDAGE